MPKYEDTTSVQRKWAEFRFSVIGQLLSSPPEKGQLKREIEALAKRSYLHPITGEPCRCAFSTIERWYYHARSSENPVEVLLKKRRKDSGGRSLEGTELAVLLQNQYKEHPAWSRQLHYDNLQAITSRKPEIGLLPSYSTLCRWMNSKGLLKRKRRKREPKSGEGLARADFDASETRSFEVEYPCGLWHLDFHKAKRRVLNSRGEWFVPILLAILDDHSRLVCHAQWYEEETAEVLIHGFRQALQKRGLPRELLSDNGSAMTSHEFTSGLKRLSIIPRTTLPYCPEQNGKQERFFGTIEGRLMAMLENNQSLTLKTLNNATTAWVELEYHNKVHTETAATPKSRFFSDRSVHRKCPESGILDQAFCRQAVRVPRAYDATVTLEGVRFDLPWQYRHLQKVTLRYRSWDLSSVWLVDSNTEEVIQRILPLDKAKHATGARKPTTHHSDGPSKPKDQNAELITQLMEEFAATGIPFTYIEKEKHNGEST